MNHYCILQNFCKYFANRTSGKEKGARKRLNLKGILVGLARFELATSTMSILVHTAPNSLIYKEKPTSKGRATRANSLKNTFVYQWVTIPTEAKKHCILQQICSNSGPCIPNLAQDLAE